GESTVSPVSPGGAPGATKTVFVSPGVPPRGSSDDDQLCRLLDGPAGSTRSSATPVASSSSTRCQPGSYVTASTTVPRWRRATVSPSLLRLGKAPASTTGGGASGKRTANESRSATTTASPPGGTTTGTALTGSPPAAGSSVSTSSLRRNSRPVRFSTSTYSPAPPFAGSNITSLMTRSPGAGTSPAPRKRGAVAPSSTLPSASAMPETGRGEGTRSCSGAAGES